MNAVTAIPAKSTRHGTVGLSEAACIRRLVPTVPVLMGQHQMDILRCNRAPVGVRWYVHLLGLPSGPSPVHAYLRSGLPDSRLPRWPKVAKAARVLELGAQERMRCIIGP